MSVITPHYRTIKDLLQSRSFAIDEYQREYKWGKKNVQDLLNDLLGKFSADYRPEHEIKEVAHYGEYFLGSIIVSQRGGKSYLVDGQQRVTSLTLLLIYLYRAAEAQQLNVTKTMAPLIYSDDMGETRFNLDIPERLEVIESLYTGTQFSPAGKDESVQTMYARFQDIEASELAADLGPGLAHFIYWLLKKVGLIEIATSNDDYANVIFESMNDRGKPLSPVDMLKAYLLAPISDPAERTKVNQTWKSQVLALISWNQEPDPDRDAEFLKAWLRAQHAESIRDRKPGATDKDWELIGNVFHRWTRDNHKHLGLGKTETNRLFITERFTFFAKVWLQIQDASYRYTPGLEAVYYNAHNDLTLQSTVLLAPLQEKDDPLTVRRKLAVTATYLDIWLMRRAVNYVRTGYSSIYYTMAGLCRDIRRKPLDELIEILQGKLAADDVSFRAYEAKNRKGIYDFGLNQHSKRFVFHLLARVTAAVEVGAGRGDNFAALVDRTSKNPFDIEHIWADNYGMHDGVFADEKEFEILRDNVSALLLLPQDVNRSLQDKAYDYKRNVYSQQNFYAASLSDAVYAHQPQFKGYRDALSLPFEAMTNFTKIEYSKRMELLLKLVELIWSPDRLKTFAEVE